MRVVAFSRERSYYDIMNELISLDTRARDGVFNENADLADVMSSCGLDFEIELVPVHQPEGNEVESKKIIRRTDTHDVFGVVGNKYNVVQPQSMLKPFDNMVRTYGARYESAGVISNGKKCWVSATLPDSFKLKNRKEDEIQQRIMVLIANDGMNRNAYMSVANRVFCNNQMKMISRAANQSRYGVKHNHMWEDQLIDAELGFSNALALCKEFESNANILDSMKMTPNQMRGFVHQLLPFDTTPELKKDKVKLERKKAKLESKREEIVKLFSEGAGNQGVSRWDAINAVTEFLDHRRVNYKTDETAAKKEKSRFVSNVISGGGDRLKQRAFDLLINKHNTYKAVKAYA